MKRVILVIAVALGFAVAASAQSKAIGARLTNGFMDFSYEHYVGGKNFMEFNLGIIPQHDVLGFEVLAIYNWSIARPNWSPRGTWDFYGGPGLVLGAAPHRDMKAKAMYGIVGQLGLSYTFWFPLELSLDIRPHFCYSDSGLWNSGLVNGMFPALSVRYAF